MVWQTSSKNATVLKYVLRVLWRALSLPLLCPCLNSLINIMKQRLGADESYVGGYVKSVAHNFEGNFTVATQGKTFLLRKMLVEY